MTPLLFTLACGCYLPPPGDPVKDVCSALLAFALAERAAPLVSRLVKGAVAAPPQDRPFWGVVCLSAVGLAGCLLALVV